MTQKRPNQRDVYQLVTDRIVGDLENGVASWVRPWTSEGFTFKRANLDSNMPFNAYRGRHYHGINVVILWSEAQRKGYSSNGWLTFKQAKKCGGSVGRASARPWSCCGSS